MVIDKNDMKQFIDKLESFLENTHELEIFFSFSISWWITQRKLKYENKKLTILDCEHKNVKTSERSNTFVCIWKYI